MYFPIYVFVYIYTLIYILHFEIFACWFLYQIAYRDSEEERIESK